MDTIDLLSIDAKDTPEGDQAFTFIGGTAFGSTEGELRFDDTTKALEGDTDGDGTADFTITLTGVSLADLDAGDFVL